MFFHIRRLFMNTRYKIIVVFWILLLAILACEIPQESPGSGLSSVKVSPNKGSGWFEAHIVYFWRLGDADFAIACSYPDQDGAELMTVMSIKQEETSFDFSFMVNKPGTYNFSCFDSGATVDVKNVTMTEVFTVVEPPNSAEPAAGEAGQSAPPAAGSFTIPKPGAFSSAGMWMTFADGTSSIPGYGVPQQCLPGVNYTQAGGTSGLTIDPDGSMTGFCNLSYYEGTRLLTGTLNGFWDGTKDEITFNLITVTQNTFVLDGEAGASTNTTTFTGTAYFNSAVQASGTAKWKTECTSTNPTVNTCFSDPYKASLSANGTVPFVINFNP
jgi:hypothetical protein